MNVTVMDMMVAREQRAERQRALLSQYPGQTLLCFTMNIPGPEKDSPLIRDGAALGRRLLKKGLLRLGAVPLYQETREAFTGVESFYVLPLSPTEVKRMTADIEEATPAGRVFDMDVLKPDGQKVERQALGLPGRRCLICGEPAQSCARARTHTVDALRGKTDALLREALRRETALDAARMACQALLYEVCVTPKPGLVDRANAGSHRDMDIFTFAASTPALQPYFAACAEIGVDTASQPADVAFQRLRQAGRIAEGDMLSATGGVNTHKGAIFSLGLLCAAAGRLGQARWKDAAALLSACAEMTAGLTAHDFEGLSPEQARTAGQRLYLEYGISGVRGEAERGFPLVREHGLPALEAALGGGHDINDAGRAALINIMAHNTDTNVIHRGGMDALRQTMRRAEALLAQNPCPGWAEAAALDRALIDENISPGGSADLLAMCFMLHFLENAG